MKIYLLEYGGVDFGAILLEKSLGIDKMFELTSNDPNGYLEYSVSDTEEFYAQLYVYNVGDASKNDINNMMNTLFNIIDEDHQNNNNITWRFSDE